jgi:predicted O-methyltransferase YrrM
VDWAEVKAKIQAVDGWISDAETKYLFTLAKNCGGNIVDIGCWKGRSTVSLALGCKAGTGGRVFAIDPHHGTVDRYGVSDTEPYFRDNIKRAGVNDIVVPLVMKSEEAAIGWAESTSLVWVDGASDYESVKKDFLLWEPHLKEGGLIAFHDVMRSLGMERANTRKIISRYVFGSNKFTNIQFCESILCATKTAKLSKRESIRKFGKYVHFSVFPLLHFKPNLGLVVRILARIRLLGAARSIKNKITRKK